MANQFQSDFSYYSARPADDSIQELGSDAQQGLRQEEVSKRRKIYGLNKIEAHETSNITRFLRQFKSPFIYLLFGAALVSFFFDNHIEGSVIIFIILLNGLIGFYQEYKANKALQFLKKYLISYIRVIRDGQEIKLLKEELVPGDIVVLYPGDIIPADVRFINEQNLLVDESIVTGESVPVKKQSEPLAESTKEMFKASSIGFAGTTVTQGKALGLVFATASNSSLGNITKLTVETTRVSSFSKIIAKFSKFTLYLMSISLIVIFILNLIIKRGHVDFVELLLFSAALAVSVVPEALPIITTFALSQGAVRLAEHKTVVKRLSAIEDLGNIEILCTDKTGTLTENILVVRDVLGNHERLPLVYAAIAANFSSKNVATLKGFDRAYFIALTPEEKKEIVKYKRIAEFPFDPLRKSNAAVVEKDGENELIVTGAVEHIIDRCSSMDQKSKETLQKWTQEKGYEGYRVLAVARKKVTIPADNNMENLEEGGGLEYLGAISFEDPLKKTAAQAIQKADRYGIQCKILSGDAPEVCAAIAVKVGLIQDRTQVITGQELAAQSIEQQHESVKKYQVFARISPEQKFTIIKLLQEEKEVGYIGDGINDAPALKQASVALAVHDAADVAREAADIILLEKSLLVIINGIIEGRKVFANTTKYLRATLSSNFGNFYAVAFTSFFTHGLPLLPTQILLINVICDFPLLALATDNVGTDQLDRAGQYNVKGITLLATFLGLISTVSDFSFFALFAPISMPVLRTGWFVGCVLTEVVCLLSIRTQKFFFRGSRPSLLLVSTVFGACAVAMALPYTKIGQQIFSFTPLKFKYQVWIVAVTIVFFIMMDIVKVLFYYFYNRRSGKKIS